LRFDSLFEPANQQISPPAPLQSGSEHGAASPGLSGSPYTSQIYFTRRREVTFVTRCQYRTGSSSFSSTSSPGPGSVPSQQPRPLLQPDGSGGNANWRLAEIPWQAAFVKRHGYLWGQVVAWENLLLAARKSQRGERKREIVQRFHFHEESHLLRLQHELIDDSYRPGAFHTHWIDRPKARLI